MKKLLLFLLLPALFFSQNLELLQKINNSDSLFTRELAEKIFEGYKILPERKIDKKRFRVYYTLMPKNASDKDIADYMEGFSCNHCVSVTFDIRSKGANPDLNIEGVKYFIFKEAKGKFLDIFPFWQKEIQPDATPDKTYETRPVYIYKNKEQDVWLNFSRTDSGTWILRNMTYR